MSLDFYLVEDRPCDVFDANITHNLTEMARMAGLYMPLWRPEEMPWVHRAKDLIPYLEAGLATLRNDPDHFRKYDAPNGWGTYEHLVSFSQECLDACRRYPNARVRVSR